MKGHSDIVHDFVFSCSFIVFCPTSCLFLWDAAEKLLFSFSNVSMFLKCSEESGDNR